MTPLQEIQLKDKYHSRIVKTVVLHDINFVGEYKLINPINFGEIKIEGVNSDGYLLCMLGRNFKHLYYSDLPIRTLHTLYKEIITKKFYKDECK